MREVDDEINAMGRRFNWVNAVLVAAYYLVLVPILLLVVSGKLVTGGVFLVLWGALSMQLFETRSLKRFRTERRRNAVIEEYEHTVHPLTALPAGQADRITRADPEDGDGATVFEGRLAGTIPWKRRIRTTSVDENEFRVEFGDDGSHTATVVVEEDRGETWIDVDVNRTAVSALELLVQRVGDRAVRRINDHFGYRFVIRTGGVGLRFL